MLQELSLVMVHWIDAECSSDGWQHKEDFDKWADEPLRSVQTVGWLMRDTDDRVVVMSSMGGDDMGEAHKIPKSWVIKIEKLTTVEEIDERDLSNTQWNSMGHPTP